MWAKTIKWKCFTKIFSKILYISFMFLWELISMVLLHFSSVENIFLASYPTKKRRKRSPQIFKTATKFSGTFWRLMSIYLLIHLFVYNTRTEYSTIEPFEHSSSCIQHPQKFSCPIFEGFWNLRNCFNNSVEIATWETSSIQMYNKLNIQDTRSAGSTMGPFDRVVAGGWFGVQHIFQLLS